MTQIWLWELLKGTGKLFLHPLFYGFFLMAAALGVSRVKRERKNFHVRAEDAYFELRQLLPLGILIGLTISAFIVGAGIAIPFAAVLLIGAVTLLWVVLMQVKLLAPAYTVGAAFFLLIFAAGQDWNIPFIGESFSSLDEKIFPSLAVLLALLTIGEGVLIKRNAVKGTSPKLEKSKRGQTVGVHEVRRIWMIPVFLLIPGAAIEPFLPWWPVFSLGEHTFSLLVVPFAAGLHQQIQGLLPKVALRRLGSRVVVLGVLTLAVAAAGYWYPIVSITAVALAMVGREIITQTQRMKEENLPFYFSKKNDGIMIIGIIPGSPAAKMGLQAGEIVAKVNGKAVHDEAQLYEALQRNSAHCKLEVLDTAGQVRFAQRALYEGDHHELGILFVQDEKKWSSAAV
ncbi:PDZ domain-containing protein [Mesobacillus zeae]|uniref:PDZ domain-containing protein n=1 Tax=Mesobacillus zeae TaxID=1917180 RepID=A0A398BAH2_9BACI|nr:PDZ domain-containing protein [Mesobacillus zeae]RID84890.1 PDZ domain-containing protein [Mesobacillus zeae]